MIPCCASTSPTPTVAAAPRVVAPPPRGLVLAPPASPHAPTPTEPLIVASPDEPEFARNDVRLGAPPPTLADNGVAWRVTYDRQFIQSGRPMPLYRQTLRAIERTSR